MKRQVKVIKVEPGDEIQENLKIIPSSARFYVKNLENFEGRVRKVISVSSESREGTDKEEFECNFLLGCVIRESRFSAGYWTFDYSYHGLGSCLVSRGTRGRSQTNLVEHLGDNRDGVPGTTAVATAAAGEQWQ